MRTDALAREPTRPRADDQCPICETFKPHEFLSRSDMPTQDGVVYTNRSDALAAPKGDIRLAFCRHCHWIGNLSCRPDKVQFTSYNFSQHYSPQFRAYLDELIGRLCDTYPITDEMILDIGCGNGYFLHRLCQYASSTGIGVDPSYHPAAPSPTQRERVVFIKDYFSPDKLVRKGDLICCRHVIDELALPRAFVSDLVQAMTPGLSSLLYLEMPNALKTFEAHLIWNIGYAKRSWFTSPALRNLLSLCGLEGLEIQPQFNDEYLGIVARRSPRPCTGELSFEATERMVTLLDEFRAEFDRRVSLWRERISELAKQGQSMVLWGAGMRGVNFLNRFADVNRFTHIVDVNEDRQGRYLPVSGYLIESPEILKHIKPARVLITNANYVQEIRADLISMGLDPITEML